MASAPRLEFRGLGPFIHYGSIEEALSKTGRVTVSVDEDAVPLLEAWARRRSLRIEKIGPGVYSITVAEEGATREAEQKIEIPSYVPQDIARLIPSPTATKWRKDLSERLADPAQLLSVVLRARSLYRGPARGSEFEDLLRRDDPVLLKTSIDGNDIVLIVRQGEIIAGARINSPLTETEARALFQRALREGAGATIYDVATLI